MPVRPRRGAQGVYNLLVYFVNKLPRRHYGALETNKVTLRMYLSTYITQFSLTNIGIQGHFGVLEEFNKGHIESSLPSSSPLPAAAERGGGRGWVALALAGNDEGVVRAARLGAREGLGTEQRALALALALRRSSEGLVRSARFGARDGLGTGSGPVRAAFALARA